MLPRLALTLAIALLVCPLLMSAQSLDRLGTALKSAGGELPPAESNDTVAPAHIAHVEGTASLERDGRPENSPLNMPLLSGDRLKTAADGRVEVLFADGGALHIDNRSTLDFQSDDLARLIEGRLRLGIPGPARTVAYRIDSPAGSVRIQQPGEYRVALLRQTPDPGDVQLELAVLRGSAEIFTDQGSTPVRAGERAYASPGLMPSYAYAYNSANWDAFDRWSESRRNTRLGVSAQYLPSEVASYSSTLDEYGDWRYEQSYGYVWYPRVAVGWRPYYHGRWAAYPRYGWTWIGVDRWSYPTHHYGRWGFNAGLWFWIPAARWAPAYVSWGYAPGYVSWCPLGWNNRAVIGFDIYRVGPGYYSYRHAWTAVGYSHFGRGYVNHRAVDWNRWDRTARPAFQVGRSAPVTRDVAVPRNSTPIRWAGARETAGGDVGVARDVAVPRGGVGGVRSTNTAVPRYTNRGDEVIRSQTARPTSPLDGTRGVSGSRTAPSRDGARGAVSDSRTASDGAASRGFDRRDVPGTRENTAVPRTAPEGPARRTDNTPAGFETYRPGYAVGRAAPTTGSPTRPVDPGMAQPRGGIETRPDNPAYRPQYDPGTRAYERSRTPPPGSRESVAERAPEARPQEPARPTETARPRDGGFETRPPGSAPMMRDRSAPPAPRAAPAPSPAPAPSRGGESRAVPRSGDGGSAAPAPPAGAGGVSTRSRGRGGA